MRNKKASYLPDLGFDSSANVSKSRTSYQKKLFGDVSKEKQRVKLKFIRTFNDRIFIKSTERSQAVAFDSMIIKRFKMKTHVLKELNGVARVRNGLGYQMVPTQYSTQPQISLTYCMYFI